MAKAKQPRPINVGTTVHSIGLAPQNTRMPGRVRTQSPQGRRSPGRASGASRRWSHALSQLNCSEFALCWHARHTSVLKKSGKSCGTKFSNEHLKITLTTPFQISVKCRSVSCALTSWTGSPRPPNADVHPVHGRQVPPCVEQSHSHENPGESAHSLALRASLSWSADTGSK